MTSLPDWLVERAALDEVPTASRDRIDRADPAELASRIAALRGDNAAELAKHPAGPAVAQIERRVAAEITRRRAARRRIVLIGVSSAAMVALVAGLAFRRGGAEDPIVGPGTDEYIGIKGASRVLAYLNAGDHAEQLADDSLVKAGDSIQLRYNGGGHKYGMIASVDGAGVVTLHFPSREDASTALASKTTSLPTSYTLDDAPKFERFFIITADQPIDVAGGLQALRSFAGRADCATATLDLPEGMHQGSLRLRKPDRNHKAAP